MQTLKELRLQNYRNLRIPDGISFDPLTIFVGPNGYGKTNVIKVLRFLQDAWIGNLDAQRGVTRFESAISEWGGNNILDAKVAQPSVVEIKIEGESGQDQSVMFDLNITVNGNYVAVRSESLSRRWKGWGAKERYFYDAQLPQGQILVATNPDLDTFVSVDDLSTNELAIHSLQTKRSGINKDQEVQAVAVSFAYFYLGEILSNWAFYDASQMSLNSIRQARQETGQGDTILTPTGENLPLVLFNLCSKDIDFQERILRAMQELFPDTRAFRPNVVGRVSLTVEWYRKEIKRPFYLDEMSDGTIRMLCWATVLLSPELPSLIVLDEPEASIHPAWLQILAGWIREAARKTQVIVSTHSSDLLDYFTDDAASVRVFGRDAENPTYATVRALDPAKVADKFAEGWKLGDLYRVGDPELGGWPW